MNKIFYVWQEYNNDYDTFDSMVICAEDEKEAKELSFDKSCYIDNKSWAPIDKLKVKEIGIAKEGLVKGIILSSFNAG